MLLILIILLILFGSGGGYRTYHHDARDPGDFTRDADTDDRVDRL